MLQSTRRDGTQIDGPNSLDQGHRDFVDRSDSDVGITKRAGKEGDPSGVVAGHASVVGWLVDAVQMVGR